MITVREGCDVDIGANASAEGEDQEELEDGVQQVNDVIYSFRLQETSFQKKSYMVYIKDYMKQLKKTLAEKNPERLAIFEKKIQPFVKKILEKFDDYEFLVGESMSPEGLVALLNYREDGITPYITFFKDGLTEEKL
ncbi:translationally controlled tumor-associated [Caulochytrium protostelioides]|nr:translationally controlled tumor-associated [Caulochytrium protostelioides]